MRQSFATYGERLAVGAYTAAEFDAAMRAEIKAGVASAYRFAKASKLDDADIGRLNGLLDAQNGYLDGFLAKVAEGGDLAYAVSRAQLYAGAATTAEAMGHLSREGGGRVRWVLGAAEHHCEVCPSMAGVHGRADLLAGGVIPGSGVPCGGACRCHLEDVGQGD